MRYKLKKSMPGLPKGTIFEHRDYDRKYPDRGNYGCGVMILIWLNGNCQHGWAGETFILPGQLADDKKWFEPIIDNETVISSSLIQIVDLMKYVRDEVEHIHPKEKIQKKLQKLHDLVKKFK